MSSNAPRHPLGWLGQQPGFRELTDRARRLLDLQADLQACAPALGLQALGVEEQTLLVGAPGAAAAAKLRQMEPTILACLKGRGWQLERIRFRPRSRGSAPPAPAPRIKPPIPEAALEQLRALAESTGSPALRQALADLLRSQARQRRQR
jgi:hypothetical protein